uniref:Uncharacterized protein n=1 Tax=Arundo donax TaxID=35708 RepID=A0A0A8ZRR8_ARUDO
MIYHLTLHQAGSHHVVGANRYSSPQ